MYPPAILQLQCTRLSPHPLVTADGKEEDPGLYSSQAFLLRQRDGLDIWTSHSVFVLKVFLSPAMVALLSCEMSQVAGRQKETREEAAPGSQ